MIPPRQLLRVAMMLLALALCAACGTGRVRAGQATEIRQEEVYEPSTKVEPPEGNSERLPEAYPLLEVDLERRRPAYEPDEGSNPE
ncbi:MAG: hypothetical protein AAF436_09285 [Myxococcota bacterium]